jgi:2-oxoglutarate ferredoxin oxidoreductase subunit gamma
MSDTANKPGPNIHQIRFGGVGGQGIVLAGRLLGMAAAIYDGKDAVCTQTYGPEAPPVLDHDPNRFKQILMRKLTQARPRRFLNHCRHDVGQTRMFFQEAYTKFRSRLKPDGLLIVDTGLVQPFEDEKNVYGIPATKIADELGNRVITNVVMLGYLVGMTGVVSRESVEEAIRATVKKKVIDLDLKALDAGFSLAQKDKAA